MEYNLFGNTNAEEDDLLYQCAIPCWTEYRRPILTGKWGTGKTAIMLLNNKPLTDILEGYNCPFLWYLNEKSIDPLSLQKIKMDCGSDNALLVRTLERMWVGEILLTQSKLLSVLWEYYGSNEEKHWSKIKSIAKIGLLSKPIWQCLPDVVRIIFNNNSKTGDYMKNIKDIIDYDFQVKTLQNIQLCLKDIPEDKQFPVIGIEPIETPGANIENNLPELAQAIVTSLINAYRRCFTPSSNQLIKVMITVPWHRFEDVFSTKIDQPQKVLDYKDEIRWTNSDLKSFIEQRIKCELKKHFSKPIPITKSYWEILFEKKVINKYCNPPIEEDSYSYMLRHTHHTARDLLRFTRSGVEHFAKSKRVRIDEILTGKYGKISGSILKTAVQNTSEELTNELLQEGSRRYFELKDFTKFLTGIEVPFILGDLKKRFYLNMPNDLNILWQSGIIGVEITAFSLDEVNEFKSSKLKTNGYKHYINKISKKEYHKWFLYNYSWRGHIMTLMDRYDGNIKLVLHPKTFERFLPRTTKEYPIGA